MANPTTGKAFRRVLSWQRDVVVVATLPAISGASRFWKTMQRSSGPMGIDLDNAEWEKRVMNSWPKKCTFVVREILQTERAYIASLEEIILVRDVLCI